MRGKKNPKNRNPDAEVPSGLLFQRGVRAIAGFSTLYTGGVGAT